ncbi:MAG: anaerobic ribonucleoside-triphosphate reductase activating protein [Oscillospiraceae bacterium]|jgi:anaerobic ribonucleoside-triphosphate reductase activating protein|nr:anaerobic ribonucleoside-triphosphate reductase activating protein [Oscillospiraceae bacterium]
MWDTAMEDKITVAGIEWESIVDGPGIRTAVFVQGCPHRCPGCHNQHTWAFEGGSAVGVSEIVEKMKLNPLIKGLTLTGGEPFAQAGVCASLAREARSAGYGVYAYTGYVYEELLQLSRNDDAVRALLGAIDTLIDGPFVEAQKTLELPFRGSANQRVIQLRV